MGLDTAPPLTAASTAAQEGTAGETIPCGMPSVVVGTSMSAAAAVVATDSSDVMNTGASRLTVMKFGNFHHQLMS